MKSIRDELFVGVALSNHSFSNPAEEIAMKIVRLQGNSRRLVREVGSLKPLAEVSLAEQLSLLRQEMASADPAHFLVFAPEEEQIVFAALGMLAKHIGFDRGFGRIDWLDRRLLESIAQATGWQSLVIPIDGIDATLIAQSASYSLAFRPIA